MNRSLNPAYEFWARPNSPQIAVVVGSARPHPTAGYIEAFAGGWRAIIDGATMDTVHPTEHEAAEEVFRSYAGRDE